MARVVLLVDDDRWCGLLRRKCWKTSGARSLLRLVGGKR
jgi:hypothetical protein